MLEANKHEFTSLETWRSTLAEYIATLLFVFLGAGSVIVTGGLPNGDLDPSRLVAIALAHGLAITLLAYATANISGGHINPAVTFAALLTKKISTARGLMYIGAQLAGAVVGALLLLAAIPDAADTNLGAHALGPGVSVGMGLVIVMPPARPLINRNTIRELMSHANPHRSDPKVKPVMERTYSRLVPSRSLRNPVVGTTRAPTPTGRRRERAALVPDRFPAWSLFSAGRRLPRLCPGSR
jgi:hypothetical protein